MSSFGDKIELSTGWSDASNGSNNNILNGYSDQEQSFINAVEFGGIPEEAATKIATSRGFDDSKYFDSELYDKLYPPMGNAAARISYDKEELEGFLLFAINEGIESGKEYAENKNGYDYPSRVEKMVSEDEGDNKTMYQKESHYGQSWCGDFVSSCVDESEYETQFDTQRSAWKYSDRTDPELINSADDEYRPYSGDIFYYYINENQKLGIDEFKHVGVVIASDDEYFYTVEGNNNDMVRFVRRPYDNVEGLYFVTNNVGDYNLVDYDDIDFVDPDGESVT